MNICYEDKKAWCDDYKNIFLNLFPSRFQIFWIKKIFPLDFKYCYQIAILFIKQFFQASSELASFIGDCIMQRSRPHAISRVIVSTHNLAQLYRIVCLLSKTMVKLGYLGGAMLRL